MDFGFIQLAAPGSQPAPLADASASSDPSADVAAAFDAALSATLGSESVETDRGMATGERGAKPAWLVASFFAPTVTAFDIATTTEAAAGKILPPEGEPIPAEVSADSGSSDAFVALPADVVV